MIENIVPSLAISIRGASHIKSGKPMQDYSTACKSSEVSIAIVCDGHGADKHFRSEIGSKLATEATRELMLQFYECYPSWSEVSFLMPEKIKRLKLSIISNWQKKIESYTRENPFTEDELKKASKTFMTRRNFDVSQPYGTTLLAALVCKTYYLLLMIGDGAMAKIMPDLSAELIKFEGKVEFDDQPHSATDSLCETNSFEKMYCICTNNEEKVAFALCSDGLSEAFQSDKTLLAKLANYLNFYSEEGIEKATIAIEDQLNELSRISPMKDDISLAFSSISFDAFDKRNAVDQDNLESDKETEANPGIEESPASDEIDSQQEAKEEKTNG